MASPSAARTRRPQTALEPEDAFAMRAAELSAWAQRNVRNILIAAGVLCVLVAGIIFWQISKQRAAAAAAAEYLSVSQASGPAGIARMERFVAQYPNTPEADQARLALASQYLDSNQTPKALAHARSVAESGGPIEFQGRMMLGAVLARTNDRKGALAAYADAARETDLPFQRQEARSEAALLHESAGEWKEAAAMYRQMLADTKEGTMDRSIVEMRVAEAEGHLIGARR
jgi:predicted negative regulator of RcsB-dependent stress response